ncbi:hypothetical protein [Algoriphagus persicinus]|uniref:hypothetical protein n=1 Tax=Algoriphagus persicinus TaxID=3108754 RepID=UPI002B39CF9A|nr:hypothetical protein [Algoriphagus sp. E1-3-M2]MEB2785999.1 hypothetical protein [Algoriphagus sp. E1-3-M2]
MIFLPDKNLGLNNFAKSRTDDPSLLACGIEPRKITTIGTNVGYFFHYIPTLAIKPDMNIVFVASFRDSGFQDIPEINVCENTYHL